MISYVRGTLTEVLGDTIVVEAGNVGLNIHVPLTVVSALPAPGTEVKIYTYLKVQEDALTLYGFSSRRDLEMFRQLIGVNGIGPRGALSILSVLTPDELRLAILSDDTRAICRAQGIGAKIANRVILELKGSANVAAPESFPENAGAAAAGGAAGEAMEALVQLGYSPSEAAKAVRSVENADGLDSEALLKAALRSFRL